MSTIGKHADLQILLELFSVQNTADLSK